MLILYIVIFFPRMQNYIIKEFLLYMSKIFIPLYTLDNFIKELRVFKLLSDTLVSFFVKKIKNKTRNYPVTNIKNIYPDNEYNFYIKYFILPRLFMLSIFFLDIVYFQEIKNFYLCIPFGLVALLWYYMLFSAKKKLEELLQFIEENYIIYIIIPKDSNYKYNYFVDIEDLPLEKTPIEMQPLYNDDDPSYFNDDTYKFVNPRFFIEIQTTALLFDYTPYTYTCVEKYKNRYDFCKRLNIIPYSRG